MCAEIAATVCLAHQPSSFTRGSTTLGVLMTMMSSGRQNKKPSTATATHDVAVDADAAAVSTKV